MTRTESKWAERVADWRASGQSGVDYARGREFKPSTLYWWSSRIGRDVMRGTEREGSARAPSVRMVRVIAVSKPSTSVVTFASYSAMGSAYDIVGEDELLVRARHLRSVSGDD
jgi:hypothetical protein